MERCSPDCLLLARSKSPHCVRALSVAVSGKLYRSSCSPCELTVCVDWLVIAGHSRGGYWDLGARAALRAGPCATSATFGRARLHDARSMMNW